MACLSIPGGFSSVLGNVVGGNNLSVAPPLAKLSLQNYPYCLGQLSATRTDM